MAKLKTLKDLEKEVEKYYKKQELYNVRKDFFEGHKCAFIDIRQEAIKWVKSCCPDKTPDSLGASPTRCEACERFMDFFNINESEFKKGIAKL